MTDIPEAGLTARAPTMGYVLSGAGSLGGDLAMWWKRGGGITSNLDRAGVYQEDEYQARPHKTVHERFIPVALVCELAHRVVRVRRLHEEGLTSEAQAQAASPVLKPFDDAIRSIDERLAQLNQEGTA